VEESQLETINASPNQGVWRKVEKIKGIKV